ncbi:phospholipase A2 family protein [Paeniglutamicibacter kerguelensis]
MPIPGYTATSSLRERSKTTGSLNRRRELPPEGLAVPQIDLRLYGNWCGPGHSGPGEPIDAVDEACCRHDTCFREQGYDDCDCNRTAILDLTKAAVSPDTDPGGRTMGLIIAGLLSAAPCTCSEICGPSSKWPFWDCWDSPVTGFGIGGICPFPFS